MNRAMRGFKQGLLAWTAHIKRMAHLDALEVTEGEEGEFTLIAKWQDGGRLEQHFSRQYVLGGSFSAAPLQQRPRMKVCRFRDEFIRSVLNARGL